MGDLLLGFGQTASDDLTHSRHGTGTFGDHIVDISQRDSSVFAGSFQREKINIFRLCCVESSRGDLLVIVTGGFQIVADVTFGDTADAAACSGNLIQVNQIVLCKCFCSGRDSFLFGSCCGSGSCNRSRSRCRSRSCGRCCCRSCLRSCGSCRLGSGRGRSGSSLWCGCSRSNFVHDGGDVFPGFTEDRTDGHHRNFFACGHEDLQDGTLKLGFHVQNGFIGFNVENDIALFDNVAFLDLPGLDGDGLFGLTEFGNWKFCSHNSASPRITSVF